MKKHTHELKDPIHAFIKFDPLEKEVINSRPFQRLRFINQLSLAYLVYPGATHKRFEHSLGVMELAGRVYDVITSPEKLNDGVKDFLKDVDFNDSAVIKYWRRVVRLAALCHDLGHLPFSHVGEASLLPNGWNHERLSKELILSEEMKQIWIQTPPINPEHIVKLAVGQKKAQEYDFSDWETLLSEIVIGDAFGVDRMDYLLRDSHHTGSIHKFDHYRLIDTLRIVVPDSSSDQVFSEPALGIEEGGLTTSEALLLSRYFMFSQVYFHPINRIYSIHFVDFLQEHLPNGKFATDLEEHIQCTDNEIMVQLQSVARNSEEAGHEHASRIVKRDHFKLLYKMNPRDTDINPEAASAVFEAIKNKFGEDIVRFDRLPSKGKPSDFPVYMKNNTVQSAFSVSRIIKDIPNQKNEYVFIDKSKLDEAKKWLDDNIEDIIKI